MNRVLAFRFDVDSVRCIEQGIPKLAAVARAHDVRFTFFVNMGYSFNWSHNLRHFARKYFTPSTTSRPQTVAHSLPTSRKLGVGGVLKTVLLNPRLGDRYRKTFDELFRAGHELALHGGTDHVIWQRSLHRLSKDELTALFRPAYETFTARYGRPVGFACPGFVHNDDVLRLLDEYRFAYSSDMPGVEPFRPRLEDGQTCSHYQVPVNVMGAGNVPIIEEMLSLGGAHDQIVARCVEEIRGRDFALLYGHPYVEGVHADIVDEVIRRVKPDFQILPVRDYLARWKGARGG